MPHRSHCLSLLVSLLALAAPAVAQRLGAVADDTTKLPWALREHYTFKQGHSTLQYAEDNAEWRVNIDGAGEVLSKGMFRVHLADGTVLSRENLKRADSKRDKYMHEGKSGNHHTVTFVPRGGIEVSHRLTSPAGMPGFIIRVGVRNTGDAPVAVGRIEPVVAEPGSLAGLPAGTSLSLRRPDSRAGYVFAGAKDRPTVAVFRGADNAFTLVLGLFGTGAAETSARFAQDGGAWTGALGCAYNPPVVLQPGESMESEPAWICASLTEIADAMNYYAHLFGMEPRAEQPWNLPKVWGAAPDDANYQDALAHGRKLQQAGVSHLLLPAVWEEGPGAMKGGRNGYPANMAAAAKAISGAQITPGLAIDPLASSVAAEDGAVFTADGVSWVNPFSTTGRRVVALRFATVKQWGFDFAVCAHSAIPDAALAHFGISRTQAEREALAIACALGGDGPRVAPPALSASESTLEDLLEHAGQVGHFGNMAIMPAPLRVSARGLQSADDDLLMALRMWPGTIEIAGIPGGAAAAGITRLAGAGFLQAKPLDVGSEVPRLWQVRLNYSRIGFNGAAVAAFPGAPAWDVAALGLGGDTPLRVWRASDGRVWGDGDAVPAPGGFEYYGVTPLNGHPTFMGTSQAPSLGYDRLKSLSWDPANLTLAGEMEAGAAAGTTAYVYVPGDFQLRETRVAGKAVNAKPEGGRVAFGLGGGSDQRFELRFQRQ